MKLFPMHTIATRLLTGFGLALLLLMSVLPACKKDPNKTIIQGHITEYGTNAPIQGARIYLWCYGGEIFGPTGSSFVDSLVTDANGAFHAEFLDKDLCGGIYLSAFKEGYFYKNDLDIHSGVNDLEIVLDPEAWLKIRCVTASEQASLHFQVFNYSKDVLSYYSKDTTFRYLGGTPLFGAREKRISWRSSIDQVYHEDYIYLTPLDTTIYVIHY